MESARNRDPSAATEVERGQLEKKVSGRKGRRGNVEAAKVVVVCSTYQL